MHGSKPALAVYWGIACIWVLTALILPAIGEAEFSSSKTLARTFAAAFPVTTPSVVCNVVFALPRGVSIQRLYQLPEILGVPLHVQRGCFSFPG